MATKELGRLKEVSLREAWESEASDFTPWLAKEENLRLLGETIGIELELESQEKGVGPFRADLLCKDPSDGSWVLIENQLEKTNHTHLGQLITYAAGLNAVTIVWISEKFTEEHRAALDWMNEKTDEKIRLFGIEVKLFQIGNSPPAPRFEIISQPNDWTQTVQHSAESGREYSEHKLLQKKFWQEFRQFMEEKESFVRCQKPAPQHWLTSSIGRSGFHLASILSLWNSVTDKKGPEIRADLILNGPTAKEDFAALEKQKDAVEKALGTTLNWHNPENKHMCRVSARKDINFLDEKKWPECFEWLKQNLEAMHRVFGPRIKAL
jgi:hypothetical protein